MKKNMVPLLAIAFVVAIVSTGLFYGLFASKLISGTGDLPRQSVVIAAKKLPRGTVLSASDVQVTEVRGRTALGSAFSRPDQVIGATVLDAVDESQVLTKSALVSPTSTDGGNVPTGMRAVTLHVFESGGVLALLRPGSKVDIQAISDRNTSSDQRTVLRTILQNIEVLSTNPLPELVALRYSAPIVTVLVHPEDADLVAVADAGARIRLVLRNRLDEGSGPRLPMPASAIFLGGSDRTLPVVPGIASNGRVLPAVAWERIVSISDKGAQELAASLRTPLDPKVPHVTAFSARIDPESLVQRMEANKDLVVLSSRNLSAELPMPLGRGFLISGYSEKDHNVMVIVTPRRARDSLTLAARASQTKSSQE